MRPLLVLALSALAPALAFPSVASAQAPVAAATAPAGPSYADLADLADPAAVVARVQVRKVSRLDPERAPGVRPGFARVYIEARTRALLVGSALGESVRYLADVPLDAKGKLPKLKKREMLVFARSVPGRAGELQLVAPDAQIAWDETAEARLRPILSELLTPGAPPRVLGVREALHVPGNLAGEGETQIFLTTSNGDPVSISVVRRPGQAPAWGVSFGEIVDQAARPPAPDTLAWYRLACFLPAELPRTAILAGDEEARRIAAEDYRLVRSGLGACPRTRGVAAPMPMAMAR